MGCQYGFFICVVYIFGLVSLCYSGPACNTSALYHCTENEACEESVSGSRTGVCKCKPGYRREQSGQCVLSDDGHSHTTPTSDLPISTEITPHSGVSTSTITAAVLIPLLLLGVIGIVFAARRYQWLQRLRHLRVRRYDEVRIGQEDDDDDDDPPLA